VIAIIDYGRGNLGSVLNGLSRVGMRAEITQDAEVVRRARALILPGDGAFRDAIENLQNLGLLNPLRESLISGRPFLGICLGYQLLFSESEEFGHAKGLDVLPGVVRRFPAGRKVPHMGWNQLWLDADRAALPVLAEVPDGAYFYFVHSYYPEPRALAGCAVASCEYGVRFPALLARGSLYGTQFHPEKSQRWGLRLLENFARLAGVFTASGRR